MHKEKRKFKRPAYKVNILPLVPLKTFLLKILKPRCIFYNHRYQQQYHLKYLPYEFVV